MDVNWHLHDQTTKVSGGLLHIGGWVAIKTNQECLTVFSEDLPALAATFAEASRVLINLDRQQYNAKLVRPAESANGLDLAKLSELAGISD